PALAAAGRDERLAVLLQIGQQLVGVVVEDLRPGRHAQDQIDARAAVHVLVAAALTGLRRVLAVVTKVEQGRQAAVDPEHDAAAIAPVAARRSALGDELLAAKRDRAVAARAGPDPNMRFVDELHRGGDAASRRETAAAGLGRRNDADQALRAR